MTVTVWRRHLWDLEMAPANLALARLNLSGPASVYIQRDIPRKRYTAPLPPPVESPEGCSARLYRLLGRLPRTERTRAERGNTEMSRQSMNPGTAAVLVVLCLGLPAAANAQDNVTLMGASPAMNFSRELLKRADVQDELGLDTKQREALAKVLSQFELPIIVWPAGQNLDVSKLSDTERERWRAKISRDAAEQTAAVMNGRQREMEQVLRIEQRQRLTEIDLQWRGILALVDQRLSDAVGIVPSHYNVIQRIVGDFEVKRIGLLSVPDTRDLYQKRQELLRATEDQISALLSDGEKSRWAQALGKPFTFQDNLKR